MERVQTSLPKAVGISSNTLSDDAFTSCLRISSDIIWSSLPSINVDRKLLARNRIVTAYRSDIAHVAFDMLRTSLLQNMRQHQWRTVAITSPTVGCGKTMVSLNLAFSLAAQKECRTVLIDLDLRRSQIGKLLGQKNSPSVENLLSGDSRIEENFVRCGENLAIATNNRPVTYAAELLQNSATKKTLERINQALAPDVMLFDMPPMLVNDDFISFLPNVDCVLLVVASDMSTFREVEYCEGVLAEKANIVGVVLNKCRYSPDKYGY